MEYKPLKDLANDYEACSKLMKAMIGDGGIRSIHSLPGAHLIRGYSVEIEIRHDGCVSIWDGSDTMCRFDIFKFVRTCQGLGYSA